MTVYFANLGAFGKYSMFFQVYNFDGTYKNKVDLTDCEVSGPTGIHLTNDNTLYIVSTKKNSIQKLKLIAKQPESQTTEQQQPSS